MKDKQGNQDNRTHESTVHQFSMKRKGNYLRMRVHGVLSSILCVIALLCMGGTYSAAEAASASQISEGDEWRYMKGKAEPPFKWNYLSFDASGWLKGRAGFGYGAGAFMTILDDMKGRYQTVYARSEFRITDPGRVKAMKLLIGCDGPFAAYINGIEVISNSEPVTEELDISGSTDMLRMGRNVLAVKCSNDDIDSDEFYFLPELRVKEE